MTETTRVFCDECGMELSESTPAALVHPRKGEIYHCADCAEEYAENASELDEETYNAWALAQQERRLALTDDDLRAQGYKEHPDYPGYFYDDPRHPPIPPEDRYLMDHPGPDWRTKPSLANEAAKLRQARREGKERYDPELLEAEEPPALPDGHAEYVVQVKATHSQEEGTEIPADVVGQVTGQITGLWVCRICRKRPAFWPTERAYRDKLWGVYVMLIFRTPLACTDCRMFRHSSLLPLLTREHRPFWGRIISFWETPLRTKLRAIFRVMRFR